MNWNLNPNYFCFWKKHNYHLIDFCQLPLVAALASMLFVFKTLFMTFTKKKDQPFIKTFYVKCSPFSLMFWITSPADQIAVFVRYITVTYVGDPSRHNLEWVFWMIVISGMFLVVLLFGILNVFIKKGYFYQNWKPIFYHEKKTFNLLHMAIIFGVTMVLVSIVLGYSIEDRSPLSLFYHPRAFFESSERHFFFFLVLLYLMKRFRDPRNDFRYKCLWREFIKSTFVALWTTTFDVSMRRTFFFSWLAFHVLLTGTFRSQTGKVFIYWPLIWSSLFLFLNGLFLFVFGNACDINGLTQILFAMTGLILFNDWVVYHILLNEKSWCHKILYTTYGDDNIRKLIGTVDFQKPNSRRN